jgi:hypothetical protein
MTRVMNCAGYALSLLMKLCAVGVCIFIAIYGGG